MTSFSMVMRFLCTVSIGKQPKCPKLSASQFFPQEMRVNNIEQDCYNSIGDTISLYYAQNNQDLSANLLK